MAVPLIDIGPFVNEAAYYEKGVAFVLAEVAEVGVEVVS